MMRRMTNLFLCMIFTLSATMCAFAVDEIPSTSTDNDLNSGYEVDASDIIPVADIAIPVSCSSEIDDVLWAREATPQETKDSGLSQSDVQEIANTDIEQQFLERAKLPESELRAYGYTDEEIRILKEYDGSKITANSPVRKAAAKVTMTVSPVSASTSKYQFKYSWKWNHKPFFTDTDTIAVQWVAFDSKSHWVDCTATKTIKFNYYWTGDGTFSHSKPFSLSNVGNGYSFHRDFVMLRMGNRPNGEIGSRWIKSGSGSVTVKKEKTSISYIKCQIKYIHQYKRCSEGVSVSFGPLPSLGISFSPNDSFKVESNQMKKYTSSGKFTSI